MELRWVDEAYEAWEATADYILKEWGANALENFVTKTEAWRDILKKSPKIGKIEPLLKNRLTVYRSIVLTPHNKMIYTIKDDIILIVDFWDTRREPNNQADRIK